MIQYLPTIILLICLIIVLVLWRRTLTKCPKCNKSIPKHLSHCPSCGYSLSNENESKGQTATIGKILNYRFSPGFGYLFVFILCLPMIWDLPSIFMGRIHRSSEPPGRSEFSIQQLITEGKDFTVDLGSSITLEMVWIPGGTFTMGSPLEKSSKEYHDDERPIQVRVSDFNIEKYPITAEQMCLFLNSREAKRHVPKDLYFHKDLIAVGSGKILKFSTITFEGGKYIPRSGAARAPANSVTWKGTVLFCKWLSEKTGEEFRLPSEAEWEYAARGAEGRTWPWGKDPPTAAHGIRYNERLANKNTWKTTTVGSNPANSTPNGVMDMLAFIIGEWCANKYRAMPTIDDMVATEIDTVDYNTRRVVRGYYHRLRKQGKIPWIIMEAGYHYGRPWTRIGSHPLNAPQSAARHGFRVVLEDGGQP